MAFEFSGNLSRRSDPSDMYFDGAICTLNRNCSQTEFDKQDYWPYSL